MNSSITQLFSRMHSTDVRTPSALDLLSFRRSKAALICGSGPSLTRFIESEENLCVHDIIGTTHICLLEKVRGTLLYEPLFSGDGINPNFGDAFLTITEACLQSHIASTISSLQSSLNILINPQFPTVRTADCFSYLTPLLGVEAAYLPNYFYVNESDDAHILDDLRRYAHNGVNNLLNFRCSMVRALSLCYSLEYEQITLTGLDPSNPGYWYTQSNAKDFFGSHVNQRLRYLCALKGEAISKQKNRIEHEGECYESYFGMNSSIWLTIRILDLWGKKRGLKLPKIFFYGDDKKSIQYIKDAHLEDRIINIMS